MFFVGSITQDFRSMLAKVAKQYAGLPVYVGCSGNFTVERTLHQIGFREIHGNDISLYSCAMGRTWRADQRPS
jgi:hypothetical protein